MKLVVPERETAALTSYIDGAELLTSELSVVEVPRAAYLRTGEHRAVDHAEAILRRFHMVALDADRRREAARIAPGELRTLDALHLVSVLRLGSVIGAMVVYDLRLAAAARDAGLTVEMPGFR